MVDFQGVIGSLVLLAFIAWVSYDWFSRWRNEKKQKEQCLENMRV